MAPSEVHQLSIQPKPRVIESGYLNVYSNLTTQERRQLKFVRQYRAGHHTWDHAMIQICQLFDQVIGELKDNSERCHQLLDIGCGRGSYLVDERRTKIDWACGVDIDPQATAGNICLDEIKVANLENIPYADQSFNVVTGLWVLEHLPNPAAVFSEIYRVLRPGGSFIFATPNARSGLLLSKRVLKPAWARTLNRRWYGRVDHDIFPTFYRSNTVSTIKRLSQNTGFSRSEFYQVFDPSYTSFNQLTFWLSEYAENIFGKLWPSLTRPHVVGRITK